MRREYNNGPGTVARWLRNSLFEGSDRSRGGGFWQEGGLQAICEMCAQLPFSGVNRGSFLDKF